MKKIVLVLSMMIACMVNANAQGSYRGFVDVGPSFGHGVSLDITTAHGYQFNKNWFAGIGTGLVNIIETSVYESKSGIQNVEECYFPIFAKVRYDILSEKALTWFADANIGYAFTSNYMDTGRPLYAAALFGVRHRLTEKLGLNIGVGCSVIPSFRFRYSSSTSIEDIEEKQSTIKFNIKVGIDF